MKEFILVYLVRKYANRASISMFSHISNSDIKTALRIAKSEYKTGSEKELIQQTIKTCIFNYFESTEPTQKETKTV